jgi:hypothetical protein
MLLLGSTLLLPPREKREGTLHGYGTLGTPRTRHGSEAQAKQLLGRRKGIERCQDSSDLALPDIQDVDTVDIRLATGRCIPERAQRM